GHNRGSTRACTHIHSQGGSRARVGLSLALAVDVQQFNRCQIARSILYCSIIIVGPSEEAKSQVHGFIGVVVLVGVYYNYSE
uniref:Uncharacterized protein n=1 Tax=Aegilops tauschii subsp. strangulata TaxID=200361 RepID=A0A452Y5Y3_AEGTS